MPIVNIFDKENNKIGQVNLNDGVFGCEINPNLLHSVVRMHLLNQRQGTACTKTRGEVRGGGKKPWKQKHTGRARVGSIRSPLWVGGGTIFGPRPRDWSRTIPGKVKRKALFNALSSKVKENKLLVLDSISFPEVKTKLAADMLSRFNIKNALLVLDKKDENVLKSFRNIKIVDVLPFESLNVYDVMRRDTLICTKNSVEKIQEYFGD
ncbi:MAG TPA: 50S ribosomal protein L4 [bacterium]|uniref:Large ribosomal subunit protein uL4 n=1 Tax=uncultured bacterium Rifle_16ft_4_minimus_4564 TaxID=1665161 RepID=A0A0H4TCK7_9BACT|nr:50S ribosomal protein L4/L1e, large subunit ribosomal protein L4 [uncultured bacterium Rifle_16ft_4_minimus_4564]